MKDLDRELQGLQVAGRGKPSTKSTVGAITASPHHMKGFLPIIQIPTHEEDKEDRYCKEQPPYIRPYRMRPEEGEPEPKGSYEHAAPILKALGLRMEGYSIPGMAEAMEQPLATERPVYLSKAKGKSPRRRGRAAAMQHAKEVEAHAQEIGLFQLLEETKATKPRCSACQAASDGYSATTTTATSSGSEGTGTYVGRRRNKRGRRRGRGGQALQEHIIQYTTPPPPWLPLPKEQHAPVDQGQAFPRERTPPWEEAKPGTVKMGPAEMAIIPPKSTIMVPARISAISNIPGHYMVIRGAYGNMAAYQDYGDRINIAITNPFDATQVVPPGQVLGHLIT